MTISLKLMSGVKWLVICLSVVFIMRQGIWTGWKTLGSDFPNYWLSAKLFVAGEDVAEFYDTEWFTAEGEVYGINNARFIPFPPMTALVMVPISWLAPLTAKRVWILCNLLLLIVAIRGVKSVSGLSWIDAYLLFALCAIPIANNFRLGQLYVILLLSMIWSYQLILKGKVTASLTLITLAAAVKYITVLLLIPFVLYHGKKVIWTSFLTFVLLVILQVSAMGLDASMAWLKILTSHLSGDIPGQGHHPFAFQSIESLLSNLFDFHPVYNPVPVFENTTVKLIIKLVWHGTIIIPTLLIMTKYRKAAKHIQLNVSIVLLLSALMVLTPASATYHMIILILPMALFLKPVLQQHNFKVAYLIFALFALASNLLHHWFVLDTGNGFLNVLVRYPRLLGLIILWVLILTWFYSNHVNNATKIKLNRS